MTRRTDRRAACPRAPRARTTVCAAALRSEVRALRRRIEGLWSAALLGEELAVEDVHAIALALSALRLRIEAMPPEPAEEPLGRDVAVAREDVACCVVAVSDLVAYFAAV